MVSIAQYQKMLTTLVTIHCLHGMPYEPALRWLLSLGYRCREYVRCGLGSRLFCLLSHARLAFLTTAVAEV